MNTRLLSAMISVWTACAFGQTSSSSSSTPSRPLDPLIAGESAWQMTTDQFEQQFAKLRFDWLSPAKDSARFFGAGLGIYDGEVRLSEAIIEFKESKVNRINLSLFNRGDSEITVTNAEQFEKQAFAVRDILVKKLGAQPTRRTDKSAVNAEGLMWMKPPSAYLLEYSFQREVKSRDVPFRPEFIRLRIANVGAGSGMNQPPASISGAAPVAKASLAGNVKKEPNGDVLIPNVPMVDQGPKGYCVVATAERMFRYMGMPVDQHELAQAADTGIAGGTSPDKMYEALNKLEARFKFRMRAVQDWEWMDFKKMIESDYNREARRRGKQEIDFSSFGSVIDLSEVYDRLDGETLQMVRTEKDKAGYGKFQRAIAALIDQGIPLMWSVHVGLLPEPEIPQKGVSGHMRLIIGYNPKTSEILFSDSWGAEHALKRMPMNQARAITDGLYYMEPMK